MAAALGLRATYTPAVQLRRDPSLSAYVSGDARSTAERLVQLGAASQRHRRRLLRPHHPGAPVLLITDPWQLPRATRAFARQGLQVHPLAAEPPLSAPERNRLALRETAATLLFRSQGRI